MINTVYSVLVKIILVFYNIWYKLSCKVGEWLNQFSDVIALSVHVIISMHCIYPSKFIPEKISQMKFWYHSSGQLGEQRHSSSPLWAQLNLGWAYSLGSIFLSYPMWSNQEHTHTRTHTHTHTHTQLRNLKDCLNL